MNTTFKIDGFRFIVAALFCLLYLVLGFVQLQIGRKEKSDFKIKGAKRTIVIACSLLVILAVLRNWLS
jgi:hypothetical protein